MQVLYLEGDPCSPKYVGAGLRKLGFDVAQRVDEPFDGDVGGADVILLSDVPAEKIAPAGEAHILEAVRGGAGLLMVGGWTSFGRGGHVGTALASALPIETMTGDDRVARPSGAFLVRTGPHPATDNLPFEHPPVITGWNHVQPRAGADVLLEARSVERVLVDRVELSADAAPILVAGELGRGRVLALATDLAPHWSGGWTDWGARLVSVTEKEQVGDAYLRFLGQLVSFCARADLPREAERALRA